MTAISTPSAKPGTLQQQVDRWFNNKSIEQLIQQLPYCCRTNTLTGFCYCSGNQYAHAFCKKLTCRTCAHRLLGTLKPGILAAARTHGMAYFVTLTLPASTPPISQSRTLRRALRRLLLEARRSFPGARKLVYCWALGGNSRYLHLHLLLNRDLRRGTRYGRPIAWLKQTWHSLTGAHQTRCSKIVPGTEARVVDYLLLNFFQTIQGCPQLQGRRYGYSRGLALTARPRNPQGTRRWIRLKQPTAQIARQSGVDANPVTNSFLDLTDAIASSQPGRAEPPLERSVPRDTTVPAGGRGGSGAPSVPSAVSVGVL